MVKEKANAHNFSTEIKDYLFNPRNLTIEPDQKFAKMLEAARTKKLKAKSARVSFAPNKYELMEESGVHCNNSNLTIYTNEETLKPDLLSTRENDSGNETLLSSINKTDGSFGRLSLTPNRLSNIKHIN